MWARMRIDISWRDLAWAAARCCIPSRRDVLEASLPGVWSDDPRSLVCLSVRTGLDLLLAALNLPPGSEVLISAVTIPHMPEIIQRHGLIPVPVDVDCEKTRISPQALEDALSSKSRALLVAHLFGQRDSLASVARFAAENNLLLIEDCAQAYTGPDFRGSPEADVSMFSFGTIKTATAVGGAVLCVRDEGLLAEMRRIHRTYPVQTRWDYFKRLCRIAVLKLVGNRLLCGLLHRVSRWLAIDWDLTLNRSTRGFRGGDLLEAIRRQPATPLLAVLRRRIGRFDPRRLGRRVRMGEELSGLLDVHVTCPGNDAAERTYWVFPVLSVAEPESLIARLRQAGFDATQGHSLCVVEPPPWQRDMRLSGARQLLLWVVFLPFYPEISSRAVRKMARIVNDFTREEIEASE